MSNEQQTGDVFQSFPDEVQYLAEITGKLADALNTADGDVKRIDQDYMDAKRYMAESRGEIDPHEMFQNELLLRQTDRTGAFAVSVRDKIARLMESPYFARIDFRDQTDDEPLKVYIGRFSFHYKKELLIFDWRAPIAGMFYDYEVGPAGYNAPMGRICGELTRKRQYKIKNSRLEYALETSSNVQDDVLQRELSHTSDDKMKSIIATIQKEQNRIIRNEKSETMIIQGVAGSGKTSIALHRIAFLLYRFKDSLSADNVAILSPNKVFGDYISSVIPELGEEPIYQLSLPEIADTLLSHVIDFEPDTDPLQEQDEHWMERVRFKSTLKFAGLMEQYIAGMPERIFAPTDCTLGSFTVKAPWIRSRFLAYQAYPVKQRLASVAEDIYHGFESGNPMEDDLPSVKTILKALTNMLIIPDTLSLYKDFYAASGISHMLQILPGRKLEWADVFPFLNLHAGFEGTGKSSITKHLVIDEMQDYSPIQLALLNLIFPCTKTILGDFGQSLHPCHTHTLSDLRQLYHKADYVELNKSYRSTIEIMSFADSIRKNPSLNTVERHGDKPLVTACKNREEELQHLIAAIEVFLEEGASSLGIILKTNTAAKELYTLLSQAHQINLITPESTSFASGVSVTSVQMAKGLEFDEVIIPQANDQTYSSEIDRSLLYIACTRALHRLTFFYSGRPAPFGLLKSSEDTLRMNI